MNFKGILLDIDDTIYDYEKAHKYALNNLFVKCQEFSGMPLKAIEKAYFDARQHVKSTLSNTASSHNRLLYIQRMFELLELSSLDNCIALYDTYWDVFLENMHVYEGFGDFMKQTKNMKICLLTDLTAHIQHRKVLRLGLNTYADFMVTSEEVGIEKPHEKMFNAGMEKLNLRPADVCMIGDNFEKDIIGASALDIYAFWYNAKGEIRSRQSDRICEFTSFNDLKWNKK